jgi:hypothetical protein
MTDTDTDTRDAPAPRADSPEPVVFEFGDGTLTIGQTGTPIDVSCLVNSAKVTPSKDQADSTTKLCGTVRQGKVTYTYALSGNVDVDIADEAGLFALGWAYPGTECEFTFTPSIEAGTAMAGVLVIDPLEFGGDETGATMVSDFEFSIVGKPTLTYAVPAP